MAEVTTFRTTEPTIAPFNTSAFGSTANTNIPFAMCSHVDEFDLPAVGSGDTGRLVLQLVIPPNYLLQLNGFHLDTFATSEPKWDAGVMKMQYTGQNSFSPGYNQVPQYFPMAVTSNAGIGSTQYKNVSIANAGDNSAYDVNSPVNFLVSSDSSSEENVVIYLYSTVSTVHDANVQLAVNWKMYDIAQGNHPFLPSK